MASPFPNLRVIDHPLIQHKLSHMRDKRTPPQVFRALLREIAMLMGFEVFRGLTLAQERIETPLTAMQAPFVKGTKIAIVPILRAGTGMADGLLDLVPFADVGHIGLYRDKTTHRPVQYLVKLPPSDHGVYVVVDPMLATGHSAAKAVDVLLEHGVAKASILFLALVAAPEGMRAFNEKHADVPVFVASLDERLDERAYIIPGLGDAGDRLFGTP